MPKFAAVYVNRPLETAYTYRVPAHIEDRVLPGSRVKVPLGKGSSMGVVAEVFDEAPAGFPAFRLKSLSRVLEWPPALDAGLLELGHRVSRETMCAPGEAFHAMVPSYSLPQPPPRFRMTVPVEAALEKVSARASKQRALVEALGRARDGLTRAKLVSIGGSGALKALEGKQLLEKLGRDVVELEAAAAEPIEPPGVFPALLPYQETAFQAIEEDLGGRRHRTHLLHGVTGSGKTEVYLAAIRAALRQGRTALFLIPEIALTVVMIEKVRERLGPLLAVLHSRMGPRERYLEWTRSRRGEARVVLGPRSAVFAPLPDLGVIVLDEEQENTYKQQDKPRYHARDVARWRGETGNFPVILGSATPSLESFLEATEGAFVHHRMARRFRQASLPPVELVDMSDEFREKKNKSCFSRGLQEHLDQTLEAGGQALLFMNRRGYHTYVFCRRCSFVLECENCSVALTYHMQRQDCLCHHCGFRAMPPRQCPSCESRAIRYAGTGTQRVAREFALQFPGVAAARMDSDTTRQKGAHERILGAFSSGETQVLIGTQMLAKGFDFPKLNMVGVVNADGGLTMPDFRGAEKTFQLITQVAGRVGRGDDPGQVVVQTYRPDHYALVSAKAHDYEGFAARELPIREELYYPPYSRLALISAEAQEENKAYDPLEELRQTLEKALKGAGKYRFLGPAPAPLQRIEKKFRYQLLIKFPRGEDGAAALRAALIAAPGIGDLKIDVDPMNLL